jgi:hypothetical protein
VLLLWGAKPAEPPTGFKVDHAPQVLSTLDNLVTLNMTAQGLSGNEPLVYQGPAVPPDSRFAKLTGVDLVTQCLYFADKDGGPLAEKPSAAKFENGKAQLYLGYKPGCPVCAGEEAVFQFNLGLARNPDSVQKVLLAVSCGAKLLAVGREGGLIGEAEFRDYARRLRARDMTVRQVAIDTATASVTFGANSFGADLSKEVKLPPMDIEVDGIGREVPIFQGQDALDDAQVRVDAIRQVRNPSFNHTFGSFHPATSRVDVAGLFTTEAGLFNETATGATDITRTTGGPDICCTEFNLTELSKLMRTEGLLREGRILRLTIRWSGDYKPADRDMVIEGVRILSLRDVNMTNESDHVLLGVDPEPLTTINDTLEYFRRGVRVNLGERFGPGTPRIIVALRRDSQVRGKGPLAQRVVVYGPLFLRDPESGKRILTWLDSPVRLRNLEVTAKAIGYENPVVQAVVRAGFEARFAEGVRPERTLKAGEYLAQITLSAPERPLTFWLGKDRIYSPNPVEFDNRITSVRANDVLVNRAKFTFEFNEGRLTEHALRTRVREAIQALKVKTGAETILLLGDDALLPPQRYWDPESKSYGGPIDTDDPYAYSKETPLKLPLSQVKSEDYVHPVSRLYGENLKLLVENAGQVRETNALTFPPRRVFAPLGLAEGLAATNALFDAADVTGDEVIFFGTVKSNLAGDGGAIASQPLVTVVANHSGSTLASNLPRLLLERGARGYLGFTPKVNATRAKEFSSLFQKELELALQGETIAQRLLRAKRERVGQPHFALVQSARLFGDPAVRAKLP